MPAKKKAKKAPAQKAKKPLKKKAAAKPVKVQPKKVVKKPVKKTVSASKKKKSKKVYVLDGKNFISIYGFFEEVSHVILEGQEWGENLDAFNDILRGGFGTPLEGFVIKWKNSKTSRENLDYEHLIEDIECYLKDLEDPKNFPWLTKKDREENRQAALKDLKRANSHKGPTPFDTLVKIISTHGKGGKEARDGVELILA